MKQCDKKRMKQKFFFGGYGCKQIKNEEMYVHLYER